MSSSERGIALVVTLLTIGFMSALGLGLVLSSSIGRMADSNHEDAIVLLNAAESALELAARDLARIADWNLVLSGAARSALVDGPAGSRMLTDGSAIDLTGLTNVLTCGRAGACSDAQRSANSADRPWGRQNPRWGLFLHGPAPYLATPRHRTPPYIVVWLGDDASETDDDPALDGGAAGGEGRHVLRARAEAFGSNGSRRAIEAELVRVCQGASPDEVCLLGARVRSWRVASAAP